MINKQLDYKRGYLSGLEFRDGRLYLKEGAGNGCFFSRVFDSREDGCVWHRFTMDLGADNAGGILVSFYCFDTPEFFYRGRKAAVSDFLRDPVISVKEKKQTLAPRCMVHTAGLKDILLHKTAGRYLVVEVEMERREADNSIGDMCLYFPKETWMRFLPGIYSRDQASAEFTERFLSIFQNIHEDREEGIRTSAAMIQPASADRKLLEELAGWYDLKDLYLWPDAQLKELLMRAPELLRKRGTAAGMKEYLSLYLRQEPEILEMQDDPWSFTVRVPSEYIDEPMEYRSLLRIIGHMKPAGMTVHVEPLKKRKRGSSEMRLGMDSMLEADDAGRGQE